MVAVIDPTVTSKTSRAGILALALEPLRDGVGVETLWFGPGLHLIGSATECSHALQSGGIQPRHCEIRLDSGRATLRAFDFRTWLNNGPVRQAELRDGDRLTVGPLEFRVCVRTSPEAASQSAATQEVRIASPQPPALPSSPPAAPSNAVARNLQHQTETESRLAQLEAKLNERAIELESRQTKLDKRGSEIESRARSIADLETDLAGQTSRLREQESALARQSASLDAHESALHQAQASLETQQREFDERLQRAARTIAVCDKSQAGLAVDPTIVERERTLEQRETALGKREAALNRRETAAAQRESAFSERQVAVEQQESAADARVASLDDRESALARRETTLRSRDGVVGQREAALDQRENLLKQTESHLAQRSLDLDERAPALDQRETRFTERQIALEHRERKLVERENSLNLLEQDRARLNAQAAECAQQHAAREQALELREKQIEERSAQVARRETEIDARSAELATRETSSLSQSAPIPAEPAELQSLRAALEAEQAERKREQLRFESEKAALSESLAKSDREVRTLEMRGRELEQRRKTLEQKCETLRAERDSSRQQETISEAPTVLSRPLDASKAEAALAAPKSAEKDRSAAKTEDVGPARAPAKVRPTSVISAAPASASESDQQSMHLHDASDADSVAAYMEQLLARTRRAKSDGEVCWLNSPKPPTPVPRRRAEDVNRDSETEAPTAPTGDTEDLLSPKPLPAPSHTQDKTVARADLDKMRHVANSAARSAIAKYSSKASREKFLFRGLLLTISFTLGAVLLFSSTWGSGNYAKFGWLAFASCAALGADLLLRSSKRVRQYSPGPGTTPLKKPAAPPSRVRQGEEDHGETDSTVVMPTVSPTQAGENFQPAPSPR